ncbi:MAG TPA: DUF4097 family beta strand repeat-containing protein [Acidimicrobiia bacterium]|nr:DUF4097 family beta strand repeat-containing protein [Acidimicrobiia bacterium]
MFRLRRQPRPSSSARRPRVLMASGLVLSAVMVAFGSLVAVNAMARQTVQEKHTYDFAGSTLDVDVALGEVQIVPGREGEITVRRRLTYGLQRPFLEEKVDGDTFRVRDHNCTTPSPSPCQIRWLLEVPRDVSVEVRTTEGAINVSGMSGKVKLTSLSGAVNASAPSGKLLTLRSKTGRVTASNVSCAQVVATSTDGPVSLTFRSAPSLVVGRSETGPVGVVLPSGDEPYQISAVSENGNGSKTIAVNKVDPDARRRIDVKSDKGDVSVVQSPEN